MDASPSLLRRFQRRPLLVLGAALALLMVLLAVFAPVLAPHSPLQPLPDGLTQFAEPVGPGPGHLLGTDSQGRDVASRLLFGARISLTIGLGAVTLSVLLGLAVGVTAGYFGGWVDTVLMRLTDVVMAFPAVLLALALAAVLPQRSVLTLLLVIGFINWTAAARIFRSETLTLRERVYVEAARVLGAGHGRVLARHVLPQLAPTVLVVASVGAASTILLDAGLAFLGIGVPAPAPTWGAMLQEAQQYYAIAPWLAVWPGLAVLITVGAFNLIAFELRRLIR
ncbi:MAG: transporter permease [Armatimonadetes bacterium]|jgi:peptide/nickel transport system permease protein|nr:transporter permease [Armatimonadota bacterium]